MTQRFIPRDHHYAHRGLWGGDTPENSLAAFRAAANTGFGMECDVRLTADNVPIVFHDHDLVRMTGADGTVEGSRLSDLQHLTLDRTEETVPTLAAVMRETRGRPMLVELKAETGTDRDAYADALMQVLSAHDGPFAIMSFDVSVLEAVRAISRDVTLGVLVQPLMLQDAIGVQSLTETARRLKAGYVGAHVIDCGAARTVADALSLDLLTWTVSMPEHISLVANHADALIFEHLPMKTVRDYRRKMPAYAGLERVA